MDRMEMKCRILLDLKIVGQFEGGQEESGEKKKKSLV